MSCFYRVRCPSCGNEQIIYSHASTTVRCQICDEILAEPRGGRAKIKAQITYTYGKKTS